MKSYRTASLLPIFLLLINGCATQPPVSAEIETRTDCYKVCAFAEWTLEGRVAVQSAQQGWSANLHWEHDHGQDRVRISGPFSQGAVSVIVQEDLVYINEGNGKTYMSRDPDTALQARIGFPVPLRSLRYWILGVPSPQADYVKVGKGGDAGFVQQGWTLAYSGSYRAESYTLPARIVVSGENAKLKVVVDSWTPGK